MSEIAPEDVKYMRDAFARMSDVIAKAAALADKMDAIQKSNAYVSIWHIAAIHGAVYNGENWEKELEALKQSMEKMIEENKDE